MGYSRSKITSLIDFPLEGLDISPWMEDPDKNQADCIYDCYGVSNHSGSLGGGHYSAYVKHRENGNWYMCNDSSCYKINESRVVSSESYLLFYRKRTASTRSVSGMRSQGDTTGSSTAGEGSTQEE